MSLNEKEIQHFHDEGYLICEAIIPPDRLAHYKSVFEELVKRSRSMTESGHGFNLAPDENGKATPGLLHKVQGVGVVDERVVDLAREPEILDRVESLIGPNLDVFGTKFYPMMIKGATSTGWHQDNHYFGTNSHLVVSCATYLEPTDTENGCLQLMPRTHSTGELVGHAAGQGNWAHGAWTDVDESQAIDVVCPAGTVVLFSANILHGARPNVSGRSSYRTAWHYIPGDLQLEMFPRGEYKDRHIVRGQ